MPEQLGLFGNEVGPPGLTYIPFFISEEEERNLIHEIRNLEWKEIHMHGVIAKRKIVHYGLNYEFNSRTLTPAEEPPEFIKNLIPDVAKALKVKDAEIAEMLISHYPIDAPIGWHRDAPQFESLLGISLGGECVMKFRKYDDNKIQFRQILESRSAYIIKNEARWKWQHHIPPVKTERFSITFRTLVQ
jgi:alkylated DNA repair protein (DNA oxidative demethylase)